ncbi:mini-chromosome maintenance complex-binding protein [Phragmites australis]|uniref:mini-chromosome maintenance complex-binding protein n=1 Tax=Phragmites australis TaxID=29695 RepID=UPI002D7A2F83|nr:mini-chromosome maintenance complex-binding protein [Phragmites australis]
MVGPKYDLVGNPLGAVRATFERAAAAAAAESGGGDPVAAFRGKDWGAGELFRSFLFEQDGLDKVPVLDASKLGLIKPNTLVRYRGMVQDMLGNEFYIGAFKDGSTWRTNKFTDFSPFSMPHPCDSHLWERHLFHCVPAPGQNAWTLESSPGPDVCTMAGCLTTEQREKRKRDGDNDAMDVSENGPGECSSFSKKAKEDDVRASSSSAEMALSVPEMNGGDHHIPGSSFSCLVKVYDMPESQVKLNDVVEFIGVYTFDPELAAPSDNSDDIMLDLIEDVTVQLPPSKVPRLHCLVWRKLSSHDFISRPPVVEPSPSLLKGIRQSLLSHFTQVLGNDELAAQFLLLHLLSRLRNRVDVVTVGRLSLNFTGFNREGASIFGNQLHTLIQRLVPYSQTIPLSIEYLNTATLQPRKDNKSGRLVTGVLQLPQGTHLTFDETLLQTGSLTSKGVENTMLLKNLMESQTVEYDFEYYKLEMATDVQLLTLSEGKSNILPSDLIVPFRPSSVPAVSAGSEELKSWRWYIATVRSLLQSTEPETYQMIQDEMVSAMRNDRSLGCSELSRWLTMAQIMASSFGEKSLSMEHWLMVKELERLRKERLQ